MSLFYSDFPYVPFRVFQNSSEVGENGSFYLIMMPLLTMILITTDIWKEKEKSLRKGMITMGLKNSSYWMSWIILACVWVAISSTMTVLTGNLVQIDFFLDTSFGINWVVISTFALAM